MSSPLLQPPTGPEQRSRSWVPTAIGLGAVIVAVAAIYLFSKPSARQAAVNPYAEQVKLTDVKMATAQNFMGATVTYLEGKVANAGSKTVTHAAVEVTFKNSLDQVVQQEQLPVMVLEERPGYQDAVDLRLLPLAPGQSRPFRLTFEHVSGDWNGAYPDVKVTSVETK
jgi:hypothetical protein